MRADSAFYAALPHGLVESKIGKFPLPCFLNASYCRGIWKYFGMKMNQFSATIAVQFSGALGIQLSRFARSGNLYL